MATEDRSQDVTLREGILKKGGLNAQPQTQRPAPPQAQRPAPPQTQNPEPTQSSENSSDNETDSD